ncbi:MAG: polyhydroxyalkanoic acid system family protein [Magnetospirillum sp. WYHS-4]
MAQVTLDVGHNLGCDRAIERLERLLAAEHGGNDLIEDAAFVRRAGRFDLRAKVKGFDVVGEMRVKDDKVTVSVRLPWAASPFRKVAERHIRQLLESSLG